MVELPDGFIAVVKRDCPTCTLVEPVLRELAARERLTVFTQDDPSFPEGVDSVRDDRALEASFRLDVETVPTLLRVEGGRERDRTYGWDRPEWERVTGLAGIGADLPSFQPGCGSLSVEPGMAEVLAVRFGADGLKARKLAIWEREDDAEACYDRGWSDGLPVVPPTPERVLRMLSGTTRAPDEVIGRIPPNLPECTVEKIAINAVMAGCRPEYLPVVLAAVEAALIPEFAMHGLLCTTYFSAPMLVVNGPVTRRIGMNWAGNALGQGNRANSTIGRALQLVIRNVGGGIPGGIDRATLGTPAKVGFCFAEDETDPAWQSLAAEKGFGPEASTVTLFAADGVLPCFDQLSRTPESLTGSLARALCAIGHPKKTLGHDAILVLSPEHWRVYREAGWDKARIRAALEAACTRPAEELVQGAGGIAEGVAPATAKGMLPKFRPGGLHIVRAGGEAGLMSAIIGCWASGARGSVPVTKEIGA